MIPDIESIAQRSARKFLESDRFTSLLHEAIDRAIARNPVCQYLRAMAATFRDFDTTMTAPASLALARETLREFLRDEKIEFGDSRYSWDAGAARVIAMEYQIEHWEAA